MTVKRYFARSELSANWFDIVDPKVVLSLKPVAIDETKFLPDRQAVKKAFKEFGKVSNASDGSVVTFPSASAGKMLYQSGVDIHSIAGEFKQLFEKSLRVWSEREVPMKGHVYHFNVRAYRNYVNKFLFREREFYIRFTVREIGSDSSVHASTISEVSVYEKRDGVSADSHPKNSEDGNKTPFTDNKIAHFLSYVNWTRATKLAWSACICFAMGVLSSGVIASVFELVAAVFFLASTYYSVRLAVLSWRLRRFGLTILALAILSLSLGAVLA